MGQEASLALPSPLCNGFFNAYRIREQRMKKLSEKERREDISGKKKKQTAGGVGGS